MNIQPTSLSDCFLIEPRIFRDERGLFFESFNKAILEKHLGKKLNFVQDNHSRSKKGVLRGLHFQEGPHVQAKLLQVVSGAVLDVVVDLRKNSPSYGQHLSILLTADKFQLLYVPRGMAHGFVSLEEDTLFLYKCDNYYNKNFERGIRFDDNDLGIDWKYPPEQLILSEKDKELPSFKEWESK